MLSELINLGKAGRKRHMGIRPTVRGSVMNPNDHPHGGAYPTGSGILDYFSKNFFRKSGRDF